MESGIKYTKGKAGEDQCCASEGRGKDAGVYGNTELQSRAQGNSYKKSKSTKKSQLFLLSFMAMRCCHKPNHQSQGAQGREQASL